MKKFFPTFAFGVMLMGLASCGNAQYEAVYEKLESGDLKFSQKEYTTMIDYLARNVEEANRLRQAKDPTEQAKFKEKCPYFEAFLNEVTLAEHQHKLDSSNITRMQDFYDNLEIIDKPNIH